MIKNILYFFQGIFTFFLYPFVALLVLWLFLLWDANYYIRILSRMEIIPSYIQSVQENRDYSLKKELTEDSTVVTAREKQKALQNSISLMQEYLEKLSRLEELEKLELQRKQWLALTFSQAPKSFSDEADFQKERLQQISNLKAEIKEIKDLQRQNRAEIRLTKNNIRKEQRAYQQQQQTIERQEKNITKKYTRQENNLSGKIFRDLAKLSNGFNEAFDNYLLKQTVQENISNYLYFLTHYQNAVDQKFIYTNPLSHNILDSRVVRFPAVAINFMAEDQEHGVNKKSHVFREILLRQVRDRNDLESKFLLETILQSLDSTLVSRIISKRLQKFHFNFNGDVLKNDKPLELQGQSAVQAERLISIFSYLYFFRYALIALPAILLLALFFAPVSRPYKRVIILSVLTIPSLFLMLFSLLGMFFNKQILLWFPVLSQNIVSLNLSSTLITAFFYETFFWVLILFAVHLCVGLLFRYSKIWKKKIAKPHKKEVLQEAKQE